MENIRIKNYMEDCVSDILEAVMKNTNSCNCDKCKLDITAIALNSLPAKYAVTKKGQLYAKLSTLQQQFDVDIISAVAKAAVIVAENPRHDEEN
ncbi:MAG: late competence development ComFB family protein [Clostridiales bacterium]|jgi:competence protein ComFB|nr:late competence development ComFB family protein [Clostridiales bacterium]